ncbi:cell division transport system ATP-binding protein [Candidatus Kryptonium thompsonii]|uniref:Cell division ATP-binding protein FtsE n=2 Tax=Candidatus Kryptonium thompsonii TaxID=1633631 RepID=A0A0N7MR37_9BACT|nr:cell division ATP-binding protein FtsE [Candidatus Kryptonium thompsoni]CUS78689.1 cell division transport system ATP-binding protein [Candidatus Kryptonium thompsoni]CUS79266.1 cell division transport system ATP-binding protein [Candidatus Kryptonium thompsoni]CUS83555.1 cell division transport system ATP-binding protein [Candidatus Kryptonium thompsoni]CUS87472.1 cell division transport system ATP-binding protein [Candidatus Kryptonium thompsoni]CUS88881.1 cell division transport system A
MVEFNNVSVWFDDNLVFKDLNFKVNDGEFVFVTGPTGSGKSTLLRLIYMDIFPNRGKVIVGRFDSRKIKKRQIPYLRRRLGIVFQDFKLLDDRNVFENVAFALYVTGAKRKEINRKVLMALTEVGLSHKKNSMPDELSGGEQQRVAIARAIVNEPFLILADEPTGNLDPDTSTEIIELLKRINLRGTSIIMATHNYSIIEMVKDAKVFQISNHTLVQIK